MSLSTAVLGLFLQTAAPAAADAKAPVISETWELSYDVAITPFIEDYKRCLNYGNRIASGRADFEEQHRSDVPRCAKVYEKSIKASNSMMERRGREDVFTPEDVQRAFDTITYIHIERGRFIDDRFEQRRMVLAQYRATHEASTAPLDDTTTIDVEEEETPSNAED